MGRGNLFLEWLSRSRWRIGGTLGLAIDHSWVDARSITGVLVATRISLVYDFDHTPLRSKGISDSISEENGARYRVRTCDPYHVKVMLYH
jgi:hypothetical protein